MQKFKIFLGKNPQAKKECKVMNLVNLNRFKEFIDRISEADWHSVLFHLTSSAIVISVSLFLYQVLHWSHLILRNVEKLW